VMKPISSQMTMMIPNQTGSKGGGASCLALIGIPARQGLRHDSRDVLQREGF
jgi:hypothetical protein